MSLFCQHPGCRNPATRKLAELVETAASRRCVFWYYCAAHIPVDIRKTAVVASPLPLPIHSSTHGQVHVPRVWEITGRADQTRRRQIRESNLAASARTQRR